MKKLFETISCPICDEGTFVPFSDGVYSFRHGKKTYTVSNQHYAKCTKCETMGYLPGQRKSNFEAIAEFQASLTDFVSPSDVLAVREKYSLTQKQAAQIFKGGANGFSKWERGISFPSGATAMLLKVALASFDAMKALAEIARVDFPIVDSRTGDKVADADSQLPVAVDMVFQCTHQEYSDDISSIADNDYDDEKGDLWTTVKTQKVPRTYHSLN